MEVAKLPDVWDWIMSLSPVSHWNEDKVSLCLYASKETRSCLNFSCMRSRQGQRFVIFFSIHADNSTSCVALWTSKPFKISRETEQSFGKDALLGLSSNIIDSVLKYGPPRSSFLKFTAVDRIIEDPRDVSNHAFYSLLFLVCVYEAPGDVRSGSIEIFLLHIISSSSREAWIQLMRALGSNIEEQWMKSVNLALTNWIEELKSSGQPINMSPSSLLSYSVTTSGLWKVQLYCPVTGMTVEDPSGTTHNDRLLFSLKHHQLEGVLQFNNKIIFQESWIDILVKVDNIRCAVNSLVSETLMSKKGYRSDEKHFPSRISLQLTPVNQTNILSVSVSKSSDNPTSEVGVEKGLSGSIDAPAPSLGLHVSASQSVVTTMKPWKFEQSVNGNSATLHWFLYDRANGREVFSSKPSRWTLFKTKGWFRNRYASANRPFTRGGGVVFAGDEYGESVQWKVRPEAVGSTMEWELRGCIWLTYWPNKLSTSFTESRIVEFREMLQLPIQKN